MPLNLNVSVVLRSTLFKKDRSSGGNQEGGRYPEHT